MEDNNYSLTNQASSLSPDLLTYFLSLTKPCVHIPHQGEKDINETALCYPLQAFCVKKWSLALSL